MTIAGLDTLRIAKRTDTEVRWSQLVLFTGALLVSPIHLASAQGRDHVFFEAGGSGLLYSVN